MAGGGEKKSRKGGKGNARGQRKKGGREGSEKALNQKVRGSVIEKKRGGRKGRGKHKKGITRKGKRTVRRKRVVVKVKRKGGKTSRNEKRG